MSDETANAGRLARAIGLLVALRTALRAAGRRDIPPPPPESEIDPAERTVPANRRAETLVAALLLAAAVCGFGFTAVYVVATHNTQLLGLALGLGLVLLAAAAIVAGKFVVPQETHVEDRGLLLDEQQTEEVVEMI